MPPNTILLSQVMRQLSSAPDFVDALTAELGDNGKPRPSIRPSAKRGPTLLTPTLLDELRKRILGKDWQGLDRFPGWTMRELDPTLDAVSGIAKHHAKSQPPPTPAHLLDTGLYALDREETVSLDHPSTLPGYILGGPDATNPFADLGGGLFRGDGPGPLASVHAESQRLADVLNRLAANALPNAQTFTATVHGQTANSPQQLIAAIHNAGFQVTVTDSRYFANFGHLHYLAPGGQDTRDVMMPFWINSQLKVPHSGGRPLLVPVSHAEYEWHIRSPNSSGKPSAPGKTGISAQGIPVLNADVSFYFGIDGKAEWRTMDTLDQSWVLGRDAHTYTGAEAIEVTRLASALLVAYMHLHAAHAALPFGGYYALGVCQDGVSAIEYRMTGHVTLFPNTADHALFTDPRDAEINALIKAVPNDRDGAPPTPDRIFGSLPVAPAGNSISPGDVTYTFSAVTIPGLANDLNATYAAWQNGELSSSASLANPRNLVALIVVLSAAYLIYAVTRRRSS
jgi:hypothetical protein